MDWVVNATPRPLKPSESPGTCCIGGWVGPRAGLDGCGKSRLHRDSFPDRPARSELLYRLSYPGPLPLYTFMFCAETALCLRFSIPLNNLAS